MGKLDLQLDLLLSILEKRLTETRERLRTMPYGNKLGREYYKGYQEATETDLSLLGTLKSYLLEEPYNSLAEKEAAEV